MCVIKLCYKNLKTKKNVFFQKKLLFHFHRRQFHRFPSVGHKMCLLKNMKIIIKKQEKNRAEQ